MNLRQNIFVSIMMIGFSLQSAVAHNCEIKLFDIEVVATKKITKKHGLHYTYGVDSLDNSTFNFDAQGDQDCEIKAKAVLPDDRFAYAEWAYRQNIETSQKYSGSVYSNRYELYGSGKPKYVRLACVVFLDTTIEDKLSAKPSSHTYPVYDEIECTDFAEKISRETDQAVSYQVWRYLKVHSYGVAK